MSQIDPLDLTGQERTQQERLTREQLAAKREREDLIWLLKDRRGRRFVWRQLVDAGVFVTSFNTNSMQMAFNEGKRNQGLKLLAQVQTVCPEFYTDMVKEQQ
jgi:hypothetical protein